MTPAERSALPVVLLVDDFRDALEMYAEYLTFRGFRVATAASGADAVAIANGPDRPALILMDLQMRGMSGKEALRELRRNAALATVPILAFTAHALEAERANATVMGSTALFQSPACPTRSSNSSKRVCRNTVRPSTRLVESPASCPRGVAHWHSTSSRWSHVQGYRPAAAYTQSAFLSHP